MTLFDLLDAVPRFASRILFPIYVKGSGDKLIEVSHIDFVNGVPGIAIICDTPPDGDEWDNAIFKLRAKINKAWVAVDHQSDVAATFNPTGDIVSVETAYRLLLETQELLNAMYEND